MDRILHVVGGMNRAGAETMLMNVYRKLDRTKIQFDFLVYSNEKQDYEDEIVSMGGKVIHSPCNSGISMLKSISVIRSVLKGDNTYRAVHAHTLHNSCYAMLAARKCKDVVRIAHSHSTHNVVKPSLPKQIYEAITKVIIRKYAEQWLACGEEAGRYLFGKDFEKKGYVINNGVDVKKYIADYSRQITCLREEYELENSVVVGSIARMMPVKNHMFMLDLARKLKEHGISFKMLFIGDGDLRVEIARAIEKYNLGREVFMLGIREDIPVLLNTFDVFLMPSFFEGNPVSLIEAQASGVPCVVSDVITTKIDVGLNLVHRCSLEDTPDIWMEKILQCSKQRCSNKQLIMKKFQECRYDVDTTVSLLMEIYTRKKKNVL